ncbi:MAG: endonuclease/exonuclease/phosphatase family protein [Flavobacteriales bacterium]
MFKRFLQDRPLSFVWRLVLWFTIGNGLALLISYLACYTDPAWFWPVAFFGLAYPVFLLLNLLLLLTWALRRSKWLFIPLIVFLVGFNHFRHFYQITLWSGPKNENNTQVKIVSWNVRLFDLYNYKDHTTIRNSIFTVLKREDADVYCFQEFFYSGVDGYFETRDTMVTFLRARNVHEGYTHVQRMDQHFGLAIFSVYPILNRGKVKFPGDNHNGAIYADLSTGKDTLRIYNTHLSSIRFQRGDYEYIGDTANSKRWLHPWEKPKNAQQQILSRLKGAFIRRSEQSKILLEHIRQSPHRVILAGDFNDSPISWCYRQFASLLKDAFVESGNGIGNTYIGKFPSFRIDYIFHSKELHSYNYSTLPEKLSDHHGISAVIEIADL